MDGRACSGPEGALGRAREVLSGGAGLEGAMDAGAAAQAWSEGRESDADPCAGAGESPEVARVRGDEAAEVGVGAREARGDSDE